MYVCIKLKVVSSKKVPQEMKVRKMSKVHVSLTLDYELVLKLKEQDFNVSAEANEALWNLVKEKKEEEPKRERRLDELEEEKERLKKEEREEKGLQKIGLNRNKLKFLLENHQRYIHDKLTDWNNNFQPMLTTEKYLDLQEKAIKWEKKSQSLEGKSKEPNSE